MAKQKTGPGEFFTQWGVSFKTIQKFLISIQAITIVSFITLHMIYTQEQDFLNNIKNVRCVLIDDILFPLLIGNLGQFFGQIIYLMGLKHYRFIYLVLAYSIFFFNFNLFQQSLRFESYTSISIIDLTCLSNNESLLFKLSIYIQYFIDMVLLVPLIGILLKFRQYRIYSLSYYQQ